MAIQEDESHLPNDVIETILLRLPVKSLLKFMIVSKSWNTMISDPRFIRSHHQLSIDSHSKNLFLRETDNGFLLVRFQGRKFRTEAVLEIPHGWWNFVLCSGDGVVLLNSTYSDNGTYLLWNPCSRQETMLRFPHRILNASPLVVFGLCHDPSNNDLKFVIAFEKFYQVFSCKNKSWREREEEFSYPGEHRSRLSADGALYWVWLETRDTTHGTYGVAFKILCFDPRDDDFKILQKPEEVRDHEEFRLACLKGCLCLYSNDGGKTACRIWAKEKGGPDRNCWKLLFSIENWPPTRSIYSLMLLPFEENKIVIGLRERFLVYDSCKKTFEEFEDGEFSGGVILYPCIDSLLLPVMKTRRKRKRIGYIYI